MDAEVRDVSARQEQLPAPAFGHRAQLRVVAQPLALDPQVVALRRAGFGKAGTSE